MAKIYVKNTDGTYTSQSSTLVSNLDIVQDKGDSLTSAMSQKAVTDELANKQDKLVAGDNIIIEGNVISSTGGGGGVKRLYIDLSGGTLTDPEQLASNAALYTEIVTALTNDEFPPQVGVLIAEGGSYQCITNVQTNYHDSDVILVFILEGSPVGLILTSDGNVSMGG